CHAQFVVAKLTLPVRRMKLFRQVRRDRVERGSRARIECRFPTNTGERGMTRTTKRLAMAVAGCALMLPGIAAANGDLEGLINNPANWAMQAGDMYNQRYSKLSQINAGNVGKMQVAWMFSTGVLRGHEGSPLVVKDTMYVHTPFPNKVFAIDLE